MTDQTIACVLAGMWVASWIAQTVRWRRRRALAREFDRGFGLGRAARSSIYDQTAERDELFDTVQLARAYRAAQAAYETARDRFVGEPGSVRLRALNDAQTRLLAARDALDAALDADAPEPS